MRLAPIVHPKSWFVRIAYWYSRRTFGKVLTTLKVIYARKPAFIRAYLALQKTQDRALSLPLSLRLLLKAHIASINGCSFCLDITRYYATASVLKDKLGALPNYKNNPIFTRLECAALAFVEQATRQRIIDDAVFTELQECFNDTEIVELTWFNATENFLNLTAIPLGIGSDELCAIPH